MKPNISTQEVIASMKRVIIGTCLCILILLLILVPISNRVGVPRENIEADARQFGRVSQNWDLRKETTNTMSALLFFPQNRSDSAYYIYLNRPGLSFGYFFRVGGSISEIEGNDVIAFTFDGYDEIAYLSMNEFCIDYILMDNGTKTERVNLNAEEPFVVILPKGADKISFCNVNGMPANVVYKRG